MILQKRQNRKNRNYFKYVGFVVLCFGLSLILTSAYILLSPYIFGNPLLSPIGHNYKSNGQDIKSLLLKQKIKFSKISTATDSSYMVYLTDGGTAIITPNKDLPAQVLSLQIILSRLTIEGKRFKSLDFRFDKPVVSF